MGVISVEQLLPRNTFRPDDASPIAALGLPTKGKITRIGFTRKPSEPITFEGETPVRVRMVERVWRYKLKNTGGDGAKNTKKTSTRELRRWRLEILVDAKNSDLIQPSHEVVFAQTPYSSGWAQCTAFKKYTKKVFGKEEIISKLPEFDDFHDVESNLEAAHIYDPWEKGPHYVAGISFPHGYIHLLSGEPRNAAIDYVIGVCPDFKAIRDELMLSTEVAHLLKLTHKGTIAFWKRGGVVQRPRLYEETKETALQLMMLSIHQALAGPREFSDQWQGQPVSKLVAHLYCNHLNNCNRIVSRRTEFAPRYLPDE